MQTPIKNIIFDIGRVIVGYQEQDVVAATLPHSPHKNFYIEKFLKGGIWQDLDRGTATITDAITHLSTLPDHPNTVAQDVHTIVTTFVSTLQLLPGSQVLFAALAKKYPIYLLSNFQDEPFDQLLKLHPFLCQAKGMVVSAKVKMMKPETPIYEYLLRTFSLRAEECLFLDDKIENIAEAKRQGLHGIVFQNAAQAKTDLLNCGVQI